MTKSPTRSFVFPSVSFPFCYEYRQFYQPSNEVIAFSSPISEALIWRRHRRLYARLPQRLPNFHANAVISDSVGLSWLRTLRFLQEISNWLQSVSFSAPALLDWGSSLTVKILTRMADDRGPSPAEVVALLASHRGHVLNGYLIGESQQALLVRS